MQYKFFVALASAAALAACASGTQVSAGGEVSSATPATSNMLPAGTSMSARLDQSISTASHEGDAFAATVTEPVTAQDGSVAVPAGATLRGHVTGIHVAKLPTEQNVIRLNFEELTMNGQTYPFSGSISNVTVKHSGVTNTTARDAATGAAAGAVLGAVLSGGELSKILTGGLLGAAAGTVISMGTGGNAGAAELPSGSTVTVKSNQSIQIR